ncbi:hypothetical protein F2P81_005464 [Scophthalmus maximus]|uniref:Uncharacterized protein n=1 Tax=Scophthalmus maximus TaxID=52904 RepID=A0A6A4TIQ9_SCOMX|nr:hypothetical protein F2P81_005464 [Scophthalmus maximus]
MPIGHIGSMHPHPHLQYSTSFASVKYFDPSLLLRQTENAASDSSQSCHGPFDPTALVVEEKPRRRSNEITN